MSESDPALCEGCTALYREPVTRERCQAGMRRIAGLDDPLPVRTSRDPRSTERQ